MRDNKTSQPATEYDANVSKTIPFYTAFHDETIRFVQASGLEVKEWLDTGCGTGNFIRKVQKQFPKVHFAATDPSEAMLTVAREKLAELPVEYKKGGTEELEHSQKYDVITAILAHHYLDKGNRKKATNNCYTMLKSGGIYVTFETILPHTERGKQIGLQGWREKQLANGKSIDSVEKHISRYGIELLPITIYEHLDLLKEAGFSVADILWVSGMQAGFYAIK